MYGLIQVAKNSLASGVSAATTLIASGLSSFVETKLHAPEGELTSEAEAPLLGASALALAAVSFLLHATKADNINTKITLNPSCLIFNCPILKSPKHYLQFM